MTIPFKTTPDQVLNLASIMVEMKNALLDHDFIVKAQCVMAEKVKLRQLIDRHGGVSVVAQKSGIPQPSPSRMLNSPSIPRRSTIYKIANALGLSEEDIVMEWTR